MLMMMMPQAAVSARVHHHQHQDPSPQQPPTSVRLCDLRPSANSTVNTTFIILEKGQTSRSTEATTGQAVCVALVADSTAAVHLQLWGPECDAFQPSDIIRLTNGVFSYCNHNMILRAGQKGLLEKIGHFTMIFVENPNMSKLQWIPDPCNSKVLQPIGLTHASSSPQGPHGGGHGSFMNSRGYH